MHSCEGAAEDEGYGHLLSPESDKERDGKSQQLIQAMESI